jgi:hypothetical protein
MTVVVTEHRRLPAQLEHRSDGRMRVRVLKHHSAGTHLQVLTNADALRTGG